MAIPPIYQQIRVESMYWDDMKIFPRDQFREEDVEFEKNAENVDSIYIVITSAIRNWRRPRRMVYWRWGPEARFYHHLQALYQVIEGDKEMPQPYQKQLGRLWEKCKNAETKFQGIGMKRYPNNEREDIKYLKERYEKTKKTILTNQGNNDLKVLLQNRSFQDILNKDINIPIFNKIIALLYYPNKKITPNNIKDLMKQSQENRNGIEIKGLTDMLLVIFDINHFYNVQIYPVDYIVAFILKSYEKRDILTNQKNSFRIFGLKTNETILLNENTNIYIILKNILEKFIDDNLGYLSGQINDIVDNHVLENILMEDNQEELTRNYFERNFQAQITELNQNTNTLFNMTNSNSLEVIIRLPKRERKLVASILQKKKEYPNIFDLKSYYFQGEKLYLSFESLPIFIGLWSNPKDQNLLRQFLENP